MLPEKVEVESSRGVAERKETKLSHLLLQSGHHVHDDNCSFNGAKAFPGTGHLLMTTACFPSVFKEGQLFQRSDKTTVCVLSVTALSPKKHILL